MTSLILKMNLTIRHRGPDDEGYAILGSNFNWRFFSGASSPPQVRQQILSIRDAEEIPAVAAIAHRRFAIIDPSPSGHQPWYDEEGGFSLVFNGEIYNYVELKESLRAEGQTDFRSNSDTEVLALSYKTWGIDCFKRFNGFWSVAILDPQNGRLVLSRDRFGKKPLYTSYQNKCLFFASEVRSIMEVVQGGRRSFSISNDSAMLYLLYDRRNTLTGSMWDEIEMIPAATVRCIDLDDFSYTDSSFWTFPSEDCRFEESDLPFEQAKWEFLSAFEDAVRLRLRADVPLAANLSGGMDSSSIVAVAQKILGPDSQLRTDIIRYRDAPELDEDDYALAVAEHVGCNHGELFISSEETWDHLEHLVDAFEEPVHSMAFFTQWIGWRAIAERGIKVVLNGSGGDELLAGYAYAIDLSDYGALNSLRLREYLSARPLRDIRKHLKTVKWFLKGEVFPQVSNPLRVLMRLPDRRIHSRDYMPRLFERYFQKAFLLETQTCHEYFDNLYRKADQSTAARLKADFDHLRIPFWCNAMDKSMMEIPLEIRMPFLDYKLVDYVARLPISYLYRLGWTKYIMRKAMDGLLPTKVAWRPQKMGFTVPTRKWLFKHEKEARRFLHMAASSLGAFVRLDNVLRDFDSMPDKMLWRIINMALWIKTFEPATSLELP